MKCLLEKYPLAQICSPGVCAMLYLCHEQFSVLKITIPFMKGEGNTNSLITTITILWLQSL